jgi:hypothetical protein
MLNECIGSAYQASADSLNLEKMAVRQRPGLHLSDDPDHDERTGSPGSSAFNARRSLAPRALLNPNSSRVRRRHLTKGQRAMAIAKISPETQQGKKSTSEIPSEVVTYRYVAMARMVLKYLPA